jgi:3-deoxy-7-phosphoheptulonate synthase
MLRGGAYKPTTSPYSFGGHGPAALKALDSAKRESGLPVVTEVMDPRKVEEVALVADVLQIGARNMQNFDLLREVGRRRMPVLLKRGLAAKIDEWLLAAEYIAHEGNEQIILCERGVRTFETATRATLDVSAIPIVKGRVQLPVIVDPSHAAGLRELVLPLSLAAIGAGGDGLLVEVHERPEESIKDGAQSITVQAFATLVKRAKALASALRASAVSC